MSPTPSARSTTRPPRSQPKRPGADDAYATALEQYLALGAPDFDARVAAVAADLGMPARLLDLDMTALSGGQAARAGLAAILLARFDIFLLDEPTNDLDFDGLTRLERFLTRDLDGGAVIVSHDREFLDRTITSVLELDDHSHTATEYAGGWTAYLTERATARRHAEEEYAGYRAQRQDLVDRARRQRDWSVQGKAKVARSGETDKHIRHFRRNSSEHVAAKAKITDRALERLESNAVDKPWEGWELRMEIATAPRSGAVVAELADAVVRRGDFTLGPLTVHVGYGERVAILGANGSGKTTMLDVLLGRRAVDEGRAHVGPGVIIGELDQARAAFNGSRVALGVVPARDRASTSTRRVPSSRSSVSAPSTCSERPRRCHPASAPARRSRCSRPATSTAWCSTSRRTTSTSPRSSSSNRPWRPLPGPCSSSPTIGPCSDAIRLSRRIELRRRADRRRRSCRLRPPERLLDSAVPEWQNLSVQRGRIRVQCLGECRRATIHGRDPGRFRPR